MQRKIRIKLREVQESDADDDELTDYIAVLVSNEKTPKEIEDDLEAFLEDETKLFTKWYVFQYFTKKK